MSDCISSIAGVDSTQLTGKSYVEGLPARAPRLLYLRDFDTVAASPEYKRLTFKGRYKLAFSHLAAAIYSTTWGRWYFNVNYLFSLLLMKYFPYLAFFRFGFKNSFVNIFVEDPTDDTKPIPNADYYNKKPVEEPWYKAWLAFLW